MKRVLILLALFMTTIGPFQFANANANTSEVARAQFTSAIEAREPVDKVNVLSNDVNKIYFFSDLRNLQGQTVTHRWLLADKVMAEVSFNVGGPRWRVNSSKALQTGWVGDWTVAVVDGTGSVIAEYTFKYIEAGQ
ncbi:MAG: DUF2914 domain-containing protein [Gammaproteobacteria bacterium]|nr:DUF2914 domain-containing protein [Gammaproteobacteria bacterium]